MTVGNKTYDAVLLVIPREYRGMLFFTYFVARTRRLWAYSYNLFAASADMRPEFSLERYENGVLASRADWHCPRWFPNPLKYAVMYAGYAYVALLVIPQRAWVVTQHPLFCIGRSFLRACKGIRIAYWVMDHFEDQYPAYAAVDDHAVRQADAVLLITQPMVAAYAKRAPAARPSQVRALMPHGTYANEVVRAPVDGLIGYIGNIREEDGLIRVIDALVLDPTLRLDVIGDGTFMSQIRARIRETALEDRVRMFGRIDDKARIGAITASWQIGMAPYADTRVSRFGDPGKIKHYWQEGLPIVTTDVIAIKEEIITARAGEVVTENTPEALVAAIRKIRADYPSYESGVQLLRKKYEYRRLYDGGFAFMRIV